MKFILRHTSRREVLFVLLCFGIFLALSFFTISKFSVWHDESYTATIIENGYSQIIQQASFDVHPPLYYLILKTWSLISGNSIFVLRTFSALMMLGAVIITWLIIRKLYGNKKAAVALFFMVISPFVIRYAQEMRMYGLAAFLACLSTYLYVNFYNKSRPSKKSLIAYSLLISAGIYSHYLFAVVPLVHFLHSAIFIKNVRRLFDLYRIPASITILLFIPWLSTAVKQYGSVAGEFWIGPVDIWTIPNTALFMSVYLYRPSFNLVTFAVMALTLILVCGLLYEFHRSNKDKNSKLLLLLIIIPPLVFLLASIPPLQPIYYERYFSFLATFFYSLLALGATSFKNTQKSRMAIFVTSSMLVFGQFNQYMIGNNFDRKIKPYYTMDIIMSKIHDKSPIYSTALSTFFDARIMSKETSKGEVKLLLVETPVSFAGNWGALYERPELYTTVIPEDVEEFWLIDSIKPRYFGNELKEYQKVDQFEAGYAVLSKYVKRI